MSKRNIIQYHSQPKKYHSIQFISKKFQLVLKNSSSDYCKNFKINYLKNLELDILNKNEKYNKISFKVEDSDFKYRLLTNKFKSRMLQYKNPGPSQVTNIRINNKILGELSKGKEVLTYCCIWKAGVFFKFKNQELIVNLEALENILIHRIRPPWNRKN